MIYLKFYHLPLYYVINCHKYNYKNDDSRDYSNRSCEETGDACDSETDSSKNRIRCICHRISDIRTPETECHPQNPQDHSGSFSKIHP